MACCKLLIMGAAHLDWKYPFLYQSFQTDLSSLNSPQQTAREGGTVWTQIPKHTTVPQVPPCLARGPGGPRRTRSYRRDPATGVGLGMLLEAAVLCKRDSKQTTRLICVMSRFNA